MRSTFALVAAFAALAVAAPQGVTADLTPTAAAPSGCATDYSSFEISVVNATTATKRVKRTDTLVISLAGGILTDSSGRRGYIASNYQFQFDAPPVQDGAIFTGGFSVCGNGTLALGGSAVWWECLSGNFYNLYDEDWAPQCKEIFLDAIPYSSGSVSVSTVSATGVATESTDGQPAATTAASSLSTSSAAEVSTISDNQPQAPTTTTEISSTISLTTTSAAIVSSISDHQPQAPTSTAASTSSVEVVSATTSTIASTTSVALVTTISDNQPQAPTTTTASTISLALVSSISDYQIQAPTSTSLEVYTGAAAMPTMAAQFMLAAAGLAAIAL